MNCVGRGRHFELQWLAYCDQRRDSSTNNAQSVIKSAGITGDEIRSFVESTKKLPWEVMRPPRYIQKNNYRGVALWAGCDDDEGRGGMRRGFKGERGAGADQMQE